VSAIVFSASRRRSWRTPAHDAFERAVRYTKAREQFGRPIASSEMVQDLLMKMLGNGTLLERRRQVRQRRRGDLLSSTG
jgi:alkylation response protein AidB-like acyl-CoA dehydrogenase